MANRPWRRRWALTTALAGLAVAVAGAARPAEDAPFDALTDIPLPRLNPQRAHSDAVLSYSRSDRQPPDRRDRRRPQHRQDRGCRAALDRLHAGRSPSKAEAPSTKSNIGSVGLRYAIKFLDDGDFAAATAAAYALPDPVDTKIIDWLVATSGDASVPADRIAEVWRGSPTGRARLCFRPATNRRSCARSRRRRRSSGRCPAGSRSPKAARCC